MNLCKICGSEADIRYKSNPENIEQEIIIIECVNNDQVISTTFKKCESDKYKKISTEDLISEWNRLNSKTKPLDPKTSAEELFKFVEDFEKTSQKVMEDKTENEEVPVNLFLEISKMVANILNTEKIQETFKSIANNPNIGMETTKEIIDVISVTSTMASYNAVVFYDELLKAELDIQFEHFVKNINEIKADYEGVKTAMLIYKKELDMIKEGKTIEDFKKTNNID